MSLIMNLHKSYYKININSLLDLQSNLIRNIMRRRLSVCSMVSQALYDAKIYDIPYDILCYWFSKRGNFNAYIENTTSYYREVLYTIGNLLFPVVINKNLMNKMDYLRMLPVSNNTTTVIPRSTIPNLTVEYAKLV